MRCYLKALLCWWRGHDYQFVRNIHGDEINMRDGKRSEWRCCKCGWLSYRDQLQYLSKKG